MSIIYVGGIHGVGKGTVLRHTDTGIYQVVCYSELMVATAQVSGNDSLNKLVYEERLKIRDEVYGFLMSNPNNVILDTHYSLLVMKNTAPDRFEFGIPQYFFSYLDKLVLFEAGPDVVLERRRKDKGSRRVTDITTIELELLIERQFAEYVASQTGNELVVIENSGLLADPVEEFSRLLRRYENE